MKRSKLAALIIAASMFCSVSVSAAYTSDITEFGADDSGTVTMSVNKQGEESGRGIVAVYDKDGRLVKAAVSEEISGTGQKNLVFKSKLDVLETGNVKAFLWNTDGSGMEPLSAQATMTPVETPTAAPEEEGYLATFLTDGHAVITVSKTQDFTNAYDDVTEAYARDSATGEILTDGNGQVNFKAVPENGYEIDSVTVSPANYKNLKLPSELGENTYRITKITGDITVTVVTKLAEVNPTDAPAATNIPSGEGDGVIHLNGTSVDATGVEGAEAVGSTVTISAAGEYTIEGALTDGQIIVNSASKDDVITINLDGVNVTSAAGNAFDGKQGKIVLVPTANDSTFKSTSTGEDTTAIYSKHDLTIKGEGVLNAVSEAGNGIRCKKDLEIGVCDLSVTAANNGIKGDSSVKITKKNNSVTIVSGGDGIKSDTLPSTDETTGEYVTGGTVTINGGNISIKTRTTTDAETGEVSTSDGIQADTLLTISGGTIDIDATGEAVKANASSIADGTPADGDGCIIISGGTITASAGEDGIKAVKKITVSDTADITVTKSAEGMQVNEAVYAEDGETVTSYVAGEIEISGGKLYITSSEDGIQCGTGNIVISGGEVTVASTLDGIQAENILNISDGMINVTAHGGASGSTTTDSCKGLKAANLIYITGGTMNINSYDDAVHSNNTVRIKGGVITAASADDGVHGDCYLYISDDAEINVTKSYEGIEAAKMYIQGGITRVVSSDDGANAAGDEPSGEALDIDTAQLSSIELMAGGGFQPGGNQGPSWGGEDSSNYGYIEVSGGVLYIEAEGDGFDSNGDALITGGTVLVNGPTSGGNGVFDVGDNGNTLKITGGTVIGAGTSDMPVTPAAATGSQYYVVTSSSSSSGGWGGRPGSSSSSSFSSQSAGSAFMLANASGDEIATYVPSKKYAWVLVSTPEMESGSYTLNYGGSVTGGTWLGSTAGNYGLVIGGTYSGSTTTTLTSKQ